MPNGADLEVEVYDTWADLERDRRDGKLKLGFFYYVKENDGHTYKVTENGLEEIEATSIQHDFKVPDGFTPVRDIALNPRQYVEYLDGTNVGKYLSTIGEDRYVVLDRNQETVTQDTNSQYVQFEINRYYDGLDFAKADSIRFYSVNADGKGISKEGSIAVNVCYSDDKLRFGWLLSKAETAVAGPLRFEVKVSGKNSHGETYEWRSRSNAQLNVIRGLYVEDYVAITPDGVDDTVANAFISSMTIALRQAEKAADEAKDAVDSFKAAAAIYTAQAQTLEQTYDNKLDTAKSEVLRTASDTYVTKTDYSTDQKAQSEVNKSFETKIKTIDELDEAQNRRLKSLEGTVNGLADNDVIKAIDGKVSANTEAIKLKADATTVESNTTAISQVNSTIQTLQETVKNLDGLADLKVSLDESDSSANQLVFGYKSDESKEEKREIARVSIPKPQDVYSKGEADAKFVTKDSFQTVTDRIPDIASNKELIEKLQAAMAEKSDGKHNEYQFLYDAGTGAFSVYLNEDNMDNPSEDNKVFSTTIQGGGGGVSGGTTITISRVTPQELAGTLSDNFVIKYGLEMVDSTGEFVTDATASWKVNGVPVYTSTVYGKTANASGENSFDVTDYVTGADSYKVTLTITTDDGSLSVKTWTVRKIDVRLESKFNDTVAYTKRILSVLYTPYGSIDKTIHFKLDGSELDSVSTSASGVSRELVLQPMEHGSHLLEMWMTATLNGNALETKHIYKDIIVMEDGVDKPVVGVERQDITVKQYETVNITYTVYDPKTGTPKVKLQVDDDTPSELVLDKVTNTWVFRSSDIGEHTLKIVVGDTVKSIKVKVEELGINIDAVAAKPAFDFNPVGKSNRDENRLFKDGNVAMSVSDNFDWVNGGYILDENDESCFCVKAGTRATIDYKMFGSNDIKTTGKEFKVVFKTVNVSKPNDSFLTCLTQDKGIDMKIHSANIYDGTSKSMYLPYSEEDVIEFEFNIAGINDEVPVITTYEDGVASRAQEITDSSDFTQLKNEGVGPVPITIGSDSCDTYIYRMKAYETSLTDLDILTNFIADARTAEEMVSRYTRNCIFLNDNGEYGLSGNLTPEGLAAACPWLRVIKLSAPWFTNNKSDKVENTTIQMIYKNGDPVLDNWTAENCYHNGRTLLAH